MIRSSILPMLTIPVGVRQLPASDPRSYVRVRCVGSPAGDFEATIMVRVGAAMPAYAILDRARLPEKFRYTGRGAGRQHTYSWINPESTSC